MIILDFLLKNLTPSRVLILFLIAFSAFQHLKVLSLQHDNTQLTASKAQLELVTKQQQALLDDDKKRYDLAQQQFDNLRNDLIQQQKHSMSQISTILSKQSPKTCDDSIQYLKDEAKNITWENK